MTTKKIKEIDVISMYNKIHAYYNEVVSKTNKLSDAEIEANNNGEYEKKKFLAVEEAQYNELSNRLYDVLIFLEERFIGC